MAKMKTTGFEMFSKDLTRLEEIAPEVFGLAIYQGAKIIADEIKKEIESIPESYEDAYGTKSSPAIGLLPSQKRGLIESFGISTMRNENWSYNVKLGFDGYNRCKTREFPNGQPNVLIARCLEKGTSFRTKNQFFTRAYNRVKKNSVVEMMRIIEREINL